MRVKGYISLHIQKIVFFKNVSKWYANPQSLSGYYYILCNLENLSKNCYFYFCLFCCFHSLFFSRFIIFWHSWHLILLLFFDDVSNSFPQSTHTTVLEPWGVYVAQSLQYFFVPDLFPRVRIPQSAHLIKFSPLYNKYSYPSSLKSEINNSSSLSSLINVTRQLRLSFLLRIQVNLFATTCRF